MSAGRIASRYAKSLLDLATERGSLDQVVGDIQTFQGALESRDLALLIKSPIINPEKKLSVFQAIFGGKIGALTSSFFDIIIKKGREAFLPEIATAFVDQYRTLKNITSATVTTATPMDDAMMATVKAQISKMGLATGEVELATKVDPEIVGGFILEVKDKLYDASVRKKLADVKKEILDNTYIKSL